MNFLILRCLILKLGLVLHFTILKGIQFKILIVLYQYKQIKNIFIILSLKNAKGKKESGEYFEERLKLNIAE